MTPSASGPGAGLSGALVRAGALGLAAGARSTLGAAGPLLTSVGPGTAARASSLVAVLGELAADKLPFTPSRLLPPSLVFRMGTGGAGAAALARRSGAPVLPSAVTGALASAAGSYAGYAWRQWAAGRLPTWASGLLEDAVALSLTAFACRR
jgi:uncharacterized membrane protein